MRKSRNKKLGPRIFRQYTALTASADRVSYRSKLSPLANTLDHRRTINVYTTRFHAFHIHLSPLCSSGITFVCQPAASFERQRQPLGPVGASCLQLLNLFNTVQHAGVNETTLPQSSRKLCTNYELLLEKTQPLCCSFASESRTRYRWSNRDI